MPVFAYSADVVILLDIQTNEVEGWV